MRKSGDLLIAFQKKKRKKERKKEKRKNRKGKNARKLSVFKLKQDLYWLHF